MPVPSPPTGVNVESSYLWGLTGVLVVRWALNTASDWAIVYWGTSTGVYPSNSAALNAGVQTYPILVNLTPNTTYYIAVTECNVSGCSTYSTEVHIGTSTEAPPVAGTCEMFQETIDDANINKSVLTSIGITGLPNYQPFPPQQPVMKTRYSLWCSSTFFLYSLGLWWRQESLSEKIYNYSGIGFITNNGGSLTPTASGQATAIL